MLHLVWEAFFLGLFAIPFFIDLFLASFFIVFGFFLKVNAAVFRT